MNLLVIKIGGSLLGSTQLEQWLRTIAEHGKGRVVIVPGGGHHADAVRTAQRAQGFDDATAHHRAMQAMQYTARDFIELEPALPLADTTADIISILAAGGVPVAAPIDEWEKAGDITPSWDWTSDSLALWLAGNIDAQRLLLVKSIAAETATVRVADTAQRGVIDNTFPSLMNEESPSVWWAGAGQHDVFAHWIDSDDEIYCRLTD